MLDFVKELWKCRQINSHEMIIDNGSNQYHGNSFNWLCIVLDVADADGTTYFSNIV